MPDTKSLGDQALQSNFLSETHTHDELQERLSEVGPNGGGLWRGGPVPTPDEVLCKLLSCRLQWCHMTLRSPSTRIEGAGTLPDSGVFVTTLARTSLDPESGLPEMQARAR